MKKLAKHFVVILLSMVFLVSVFTSCNLNGSSSASKKLTFENGMAMPVFEYTDLRNSDYANKGSDLLRFMVYVETDYDTDNDGKLDLVEVLVQVPRAAAEGNYKAATIYDPVPYGPGVNNENYENPDPLYNPVAFDYDKLYKKAPKREPKGSMTTLELSKIADPETWNYKVPNEGGEGYAYANEYDYYLVRGFAVVEAGGIGTYGSEGFELCGFDLERDAHKCVVEWLTGDRNAYTDPYNDILIKADWSNGNVAMTGCSYGGTLPYEVATTGVKGLKTIIPFAGIASWYDYSNSQGISLAASSAYTQRLASMNSGAAYLDDAWTVINDDYASYLWQIKEDQGAANGDYSDIWARMDYTLDTSKINCSALIVQGLNDFTVSSKHADLMARAFKKAGQTFKLVLHQDGHIFLNGIMVNGELWQEVMNKWLSHYLYDVDNGIENMPMVSVQSNIDSSFKNYNSWPEFKFDTFEYDKNINGEKVSHIDSANITSHAMEYMDAQDEFNRYLTRDDYYINLPEELGAKYVFEVPENYTFCGVPELHVKLATKDVEKDGMMVAAFLIDTIDGKTNFKAYMTKQKLYNNLPKKTIYEKETGIGLARTKVKEFVKSNTTSKLITTGCTDLKNYGCGYEGKEYRKHEDEMKADEYYDYTIYLNPTSYTFEKGHKAYLVITAWDPYKDFYDLDTYNAVVSDPKESKQRYTFDIDNASLEFKFPQINE